MNIEKVISYINTNRGNGQKKSLNRLFQLLSRLDHPQKSLSFIHITGTNGKGSTASFFQSILREAGLNVGLFTSPHLEVINERIRLNNEYIADADLIRIMKKIEPVILELEEELNEKFYAFELLTTVAFLYFQEKQPDVIILEAGIGGRLDSTNVIETPDVAVITSIGIDHVKILGNSKEAIMNEKVQILKKNGHLVVGPVESSLKKIAFDWAEKVDGQLTFVETNQIEVISSTKNHQKFNYHSFLDVELSFLGLHQIENACVVLEACEILKEKGYPLTDEVIYRGLKKATWSGRFEKIAEEPLFYIDGAHNRASVNRLVETLEELFPNQKFHFVVGMMRDKDYKAMLEKVFPLAQEFLIISPDPYRGFDASRVANDLEAKGYKARAFFEIEDVLTYIKEQIPKEEIVIQYGSLYLVGDIKKALG